MICGYWLWRVMRGALMHLCTYTRYADDLTFSTNETLIPREIAVNVHGSEWVVGDKLRSEIERAGFKLNPSKTRMSLRRSRQTVTGLVVNTKPNIDRDYYRKVRAMCNSVFQTGEYHRRIRDGIEATNNLHPLEGMLAHIYFVKLRRDRPAKTKKLAVKAGELHVPRAPVELYRRFLFYKHFVAPTATKIVTEGISDITYLRCAIRSLAKNFPSLAEEDNGNIIRLISFLKPTATTREVLNLGHGTGGQASLIAKYSTDLKRYGHKPIDHPVIVLCDNDDGAKTVFKSASKKCGHTVKLDTSRPFYYLGENLYLVKIPEGPLYQSRNIEQLFEPALLAHKIDGKPFDPQKEYGDSTAYGKVIFADKVVLPNAASIDFSGFSELLSRFDQSITHYRTVKLDESAKASTGSSP